MAHQPRISRFSHRLEIETDHLLRFFLHELTGFATGGGAALQQPLGEFRGSGAEHLFPLRLKRGEKHRTGPEILFIHEENAGEDRIILPLFAVDGVGAVHEIGHSLLPVAAECRIDIELGVKLLPLKVPADPVRGGGRICPAAKAGHEVPEAVDAPFARFREKVIQQPETVFIKVFPELLLILRDEFRPVDGDSAALIFRFPGDVHDPNHVVALPDAIGDDLINLFF